MGYALESVEPDLEPATRPVIDRARAIVQRDVGTLRQILTSVYPPDLEQRRPGLGARRPGAAAGRRRGGGGAVPRRRGAGRPRPWPPRSTVRPGRRCRTSVSTRAAARAGRAVAASTARSSCTSTMTGWASTPRRPAGARPLRAPADPRHRHRGGWRGEDHVGPGHGDLHPHARAARPDHASGRATAHSRSGGARRSGTGPSGSRSSGADEEPQRAQGGRGVDDGHVERRSPVVGTTYAATAETPNATQPARFTAATAPSSVCGVRRRQAARDDGVRHGARDEEADRAERIGAPYEPVVGGGAEGGRQARNAVEAVPRSWPRGSTSVGAIHPSCGRRWRPRHHRRPPSGRSQCSRLGAGGDHPRGVRRRRRRRRLRGALPRGPEDVMGVWSRTSGTAARTRPPSRGSRGPAWSQVPKHRLPDGEMLPQTAVPDRPRRGEPRRQRALQPRDVRDHVDGRGGRPHLRGDVRQEHDRQGRVPADRRHRGALRADARRPVARPARGRQRGHLHDRQLGGVHARRPGDEAPLAAGAPGGRAADRPAQHRHGRQRPGRVGEVRQLLGGRAPLRAAGRRRLPPHRRPPDGLRRREHDRRRGGARLDDGRQLRAGAGDLRGAGPRTSSARASRCPCTSTPRPAGSSRRSSSRTWSGTSGSSGSCRSRPRGTSSGSSTRGSAGCCGARSGSCRRSWCST